MQSPFMINPPAIVGSQTHLSDIEDDYDVTKLAAHEIYETKQTKFTGRHMASAEVVAYESVDRLLNDVSHILQEKYLAAKLDGHTIDTTYDLVELLFNTEFIGHDKHEFVDVVDAEPPVVSIDNWGRSKIASKKLAKNESRMEFVDGMESMMSEDKRALQKAKDVGKKLIRDAKGENMPAPLDLQEPIEMNKTEDDLRQVKERERKRLDEERAAEMQKRKVENQAKFKQGNADLKKKPFTYDYNGVPIIINNAKVEKFPLPVYPVQHDVMDPEPDNANAKKRKTIKEVPALKAKQKKTPENEQDFAKKFGMSAPTFDLLEPAVGVTYVENGKTKNSNKTRFNLTSATSGSLISTLGANPRLTKTEYLQLVKGGNLSRTNVVGDKENTAHTVLKSPEEIKKTDPKEWSVKVSGVKESNFNTTGAMRMGQHHKGTGDGVTIMAEKAELLFKASEEIKIENMQMAKVDKKLEKFTTDDTLKRSPVDTFNLELLNSKDWGKNTQPGHVTSLPKLPSHQKMQLEQSLGSNKSKYPRYRTSNVPSQKDYAELLAATIKGQQIA